ncbi:MAG TPA: aminodeoxychorismate synthase component I [Pyrinomonadaceae bacterium]|nr:aminodeoxychorismate synthase component I [Pyrinomonadaceae bacterium]
MQDLSMNADELVAALLTLSSTEQVCILDSCGVSHLGSHLLIAGIDPVDSIGISSPDTEETLDLIDKKLSGDLASIFTLSYDLGPKILGIRTIPSSTFGKQLEPDLFLTQFDVLIIHDYDAERSFLFGNTAKFSAIEGRLRSQTSDLEFGISNDQPLLSSNFTKPEYIFAVEKIKERIRSGDTYQTNLTQQLTIELPADRTPATIFSRLRRGHPAPFAAFIRRDDSTVISASPERFFSIRGNRITTSPIKGTRKRGETEAEDQALKRDLLSSEKDRAENTMIVDLLRNDLGRVCEYGSVEVEKLCELEEHPSLFHLVSTVGGDLRPETKTSDILRAVFPCGSITGAPKISTMKMIAELEPSKRGLSMGAIGYSIPDGFELEPAMDLSVAIRTMVIRDQTATFNVGGGIVIDSDPESEYEETLTKAKALLAAIGVRVADGSIKPRA